MFQLLSVLFLAIDGMAQMGAGFGAGLAAIGAGIGVIAALGMMQVLMTFLYQVKPADSASLLGATATLLTAGMIAAFIPALRASRVDPAKVLREQ